VHEKQTTLSPFIAQIHQKQVI